MTRRTINVCLSSSRRGCVLSIKLVIVITKAAPAYFYFYWLKTIENYCVNIKFCIALLSPHLYKCKLESSSLSSTKTLHAMYIYVWILRHMTFSRQVSDPNERHAKGRTCNRKGISLTIEHDLSVLQNYSRYLLSWFYPKIHLQDL